MNPENPPVTPAEIIDLILEEIRAEILEMRYSNIVRSVYHVYLNSTRTAPSGPRFAAHERRSHTRAERRTRRPE